MLVAGRLLVVELVHNAERHDEPDAVGADQRAPVDLVEWLVVQEHVRVEDADPGRGLGEPRAHRLHRGVQFVEPRDLRLHLLASHLLGALADAGADPPEPFGVEPLDRDVREERSEPVLEGVHPGDVHVRVGGAVPRAERDVDEPVVDRRRVHDWPREHRTRMTLPRR
jgi:hypothetical protein